jgi:hypothetical protein
LADSGWVLFEWPKVWSFFGPLVGGWVEEVTQRAQRSAEGAEKKKITWNMWNIGRFLRFWCSGVEQGSAREGMRGCRIRLFGCVHSLCVVVLFGPGETEEWRTDGVRAGIFMRGVRVRSFTGNELRAVHSLLFGLAVRISVEKIRERV